MSSLPLRDLRPSESGQSSSTSPGQQRPLLMSASTGSESRLTSPTLKQSEAGSSYSKRRRVPESITKNACQSCKKARAKCDGKSPCARCEARPETECIYESHVKLAKEELMNQIRDLLAKDREAGRIYKGLRSNDLAPLITERFRNGEGHNDIIAFLDRVALPSIKSDNDSYSPGASHARQNSHGGSDRESKYLPSLYWTTVTREEAVVRHLLQLYLSWVHPVAFIFNEPDFFQSYHDKTQDYCSPLLVNAMCALACNLHDASDNDKVDFRTLGSQFADAFRDKFDPSDKRVPTIQATAVMFLVECARGSPRAASYLKLATNSIAEVAARGKYIHPRILTTTIQGIRCLNVEWAQAVFECPLSPSTRDVENLALNIGLDERPWYNYRHLGDIIPSYPSMLDTVIREKMKLISIISDVCAMLYSPTTTMIHAPQILGAYARFIEWEASLPPCLVNIEATNQPLPHVTHLLVLYHHSVTQLLRPLIDLANFPSILVEEVILNHAQRGLYLLEINYRVPWGCRYQLCLQSFVVANLCDLVARYWPSVKTPTADKDGVAALIFGLDVLGESWAGGAGPPVAGVLRELLRRAPASYTTPINMPIEYETQSLRDKDSGRALRCTFEEFMDACTYPIYFQPPWGVREKFDENLARSWVEDGPKYGFNRPAGGITRSLHVVQSVADERATYSMEIKNLLNTN